MYATSYQVSCDVVIQFISKEKVILNRLYTLSISLQNKKLTIIQGCARDLSDRDETRDAKVRDETETLGILSETRPRPRRWGSETRPRPRRSSSRDLGRDVWWKKLSTTKSTELVNTLYLWCWDFAARALCALRGIAAVSRPSVCSLSVTLRYRGHISWATLRRK